MTKNKKIKKSISNTTSSDRTIKQLGISPKLINDSNFLTLLHQFINAIPLLIVVIHPKDYSIVLVNNHLSHSLQLPVEQLIGKNFLDFLPPGEIRTRRKTYADKTIQNKKSINLIDKRGNKYFDSKTIPVLDSDGNVIYAIAIMQDITKRKDAQKTLADKEQLFSSMIQTSHDIIYITTKEGNIVYQSPSAKKTLGHSTKRIGRSILEHVHPEDLTRAKKFVKEVVSTPGVSKKIVVRVKGANGEYHYLEGIANNQLHNDSINGVIINSRDISERVHAQKRLEETVHYLDNILKNSKEIIFVINNQKKITIWNQSAERITGFSSKTVVGRLIDELPFITNKGELTECVDHLFSKKKRKIQQIILHSKNGEITVLKPSISIVSDNDKQVSDIIFICNDITNKFQIHETLIPGLSYLLNSEDNEELKNLSTRLLLEGKSELFITRKPFKIKSQFHDSSNIQFCFFSSLKDEEHETIQDLKDLKNQIIRFVKQHKNSVVFIDRIDYLMNKYEFLHLSTALYEINDYIKQYKSLLIVRVNIKQLDEKQYSTFKEEFIELSQSDIQDIHLDESHFEILKFINREHEWNKTVNQNKIVKEFQISKLTAKKRINELLDKQLLYSKRKGRSKQLYLTKKGSTLLTKRNKQS